MTSDSVGIVLFRYIYVMLNTVKGEVWMEIVDVHPLDSNVDMFEAIQNRLVQNINLDSFTHPFHYCAGVDIAYWETEGTQWGACGIIVVDFVTKGIVEKVHSIGKVSVPYIPGYLAFRELPLILKAAKKFSNVPDLFMFDGNGYLHPNNMGIATHASFFLNKPTIGIAKSYLKVYGVQFQPPENKAGSFENIVVGEEVFGRVLRTRKDVKPIFVSCGNYIDLDKATEVTLHFTNHESRLPIPIRLADLESRNIRRRIIQMNHGE